MERISAFMDGEVGDDEVAAQVARLKQDPALRERWDAYHLIGDAMRGNAGLAGQDAFMARFGTALAQEPTVLAPKAPVHRDKAYKVALSLAASVAGIAVVGWLAISNPFGPAQQDTVARNEVVKPDNGAVNDYLTAHSTARQGIRTVAGNEADMR
jgi:sigma-E factor negative regulatory protein RseA